MGIYFYVFINRKERRRNDEEENRSICIAADISDNQYVMYMG